MQNNQVSLLPIIQFIYNITLQKGLKILLFKVNYGYKPKTLLLLRQVKKSSKIAIKKSRDFYKPLQRLLKIGEISIKIYKKVL